MSNTHTTNELLTPEQAVPADARLRAGGGINYSDLVMVVHPSVPAKDVKEFIALAKSKPGELNYRLVRYRHAVPHGRRAVQST